MISRVLIGIAIILAIGGVVLRSSNANRATTLVTAVTTADTAGTDSSVAQATLMAYIHSHMGTHATYTLKGSYDRAVTAAQAAAAAQSANSQIYAAAQAACGGKTDSITQAKCNQAYLSQHLTAEPTPTQVTPPVLASYEHSVTAPFWTPDDAGIAFGLAVAAGIIGIIGITKGKKS